MLKNYKIKDEDIEILEIENRSDCDEIQNYMKSITGARSVSNFLPSWVAILLIAFFI